MFITNQQKSSYESIKMDGEGLGYFLGNKI